MPPEYVRLASLPVRVDCGARDRSDPHEPGKAHRDATDLPVGAVQLAQGARRALGEDLARLGQRHAPRGPLVELAAGERLHFPQETRGGGLGDRQARGGRADLPRLRQRGEDSQMRGLQPAADEPVLGGVLFEEHGLGVITEMLYRGAISVFACSLRRLLGC